MTRHGLMFAWAVGLVGCGGGLPVEVRVDQYTIPLSIDDYLDDALSSVQSLGILGEGTVVLPEQWPDSLPDIEYTWTWATDPVAVDLTPEPGSDLYEQYELINQANKVITRVELNRLVLRFDSNTITLRTPELRLQIADDANASVDDRLAWRTIGKLPEAEPFYTGDLDFQFLRGGETYLNRQLMDDQKEFAMRVLGRFEVDTKEYPQLPSGEAILRLIAVATFFIEPVEAAKTGIEYSQGTTEGSQE